LPVKVDVAAHGQVGHGANGHCKVHQSFAEEAQGGVLGVESKESSDEGVSRASGGGGGSGTSQVVHGLEVDARASFVVTDKIGDAAGVGVCELTEHGGEGKGGAHGAADRSLEHCHHAGAQAEVITRS